MGYDLFTLFNIRPQGYPSTDQEVGSSNLPGRVNVFRSFDVSFDGRP